MKHQICRTVLAAAAVTAGVFLSACGLFRTTEDDVFDDAEDAIATDLAAEDIKTAMEERCGLALDYGTQFGGNAPCHIRVNLATDGAVVEEAANRLIRNLG